MSNLQLIHAPDTTGQAVSIVRDTDGLFIIATDTGEVLEQQLTKVLTKQPYINKVSEYVGIDTRFPTQARDAAELLEAAEVHDPFIGQLTADYRNILELLRETLKPPEVLLFRYLCENLAARNYWIGRNCELTAAFPDLSRAGLYQAMKTLEGGLIRRPNKGGRGPQTILVHPWYAFRGASFFRNNALIEWCKPRRD